MFRTQHVPLMTCLGAVLGILLTACESRPTLPSPVAIPQPATPGRGVLMVTRLAAFGDSMTAGVVSPPVLAVSGPFDTLDSYPTKLQGLLSAAYPAQSITISRRGVPGEFARQANVRFRAMLREDQPEVVLLLHGANDLFGDGAAAITPTVVAMRTMIQDARNAGARVMVGTLPPQRVGGLRAAGAGAVLPFRQALMAMADAEGAVVVDFYRFVDLSLIGGDGLHPTDAGYERMAAVFFDHIRALYAPST